MKKVLKTILLAVLSVAFVMTMVACSSNDGGSSEKGLLCKTIDGVYTVYKYVDDGRTETTLDIGAEIEKSGQNFEEIRIKKGAFSGNNTIKSLIVPNTTVTIDDGAFAGMKALESITLPFVGGSVDSVGIERTFGYLFSESEYDGGCKVSITYNSGSDESAVRYMPSSLTKVVLNAKEGYNVPMFAFAGCVNLAEVQLSNGIAEIGEYAFSECKNLVTVSVPATVTNVRKGAFTNCTSLNDNVLASATALTTIGESAFQGAKIKALTLNNVEVGAKAFSGSKVEEVTLIGTVDIGVSAFADCTLLKTVTANGASGTIRQFAFKGCTILTEFDVSAFTVEAPIFDIAK